MMKLSFFADENIQESLIKWLKTNGFNIPGIRSENLFGMDDEAIIQKAFSEKKSSSLETLILGKLFLQKSKVLFSYISKTRPSTF